MLEEVIHCKISKKDFFEFKLQNSSDRLITNEENSRLPLSSLGLADYKVCNSLRGENTYYGRVGPSRRKQLLSQNAVGTIFCFI